jgi:hypothetical protein
MIQYGSTSRRRLKNFLSSSLSSFNFRLAQHPALTPVSTNLHSVDSESFHVRERTKEIDDADNDVAR